MVQGNMIDVADLTQSITGFEDSIRKCKDLLHCLTVFSLCVYTQKCSIKMLFLTNSRCISNTVNADIYILPLPDENKIPNDVM